MILGKYSVAVFCYNCIYGWEKLIFEKWKVKEQRVRLLIYQKSLHIVCVVIFALKYLLVFHFLWRFELICLKSKSLSTQL